MVAPHRLLHSANRPDHVRLVDHVAAADADKEVLGVVRHADNLEEAIIASVNHDGDSDSTGSITGNIMGVIYGYEYIKQRNIFCPRGHDFEHTIELSDIILALADDLTTSCVIGEIEPINTYEERRWELRYCNMLPVGLGRIPDEEKFFCRRR